MNWQELARKYIEAVLEQRKRVSGNEGPTDNCEKEAHSRWECCDMHRELEAHGMMISAMGFALNLAYGLKGPSTFDTRLSEFGADTADWKQAQVGSVYWHQALGEAADIEMPEELLK